ncbi:type IV pili twitching motility protein PilT [Candidatus Methylomirabilis limnetica]|uniref:Type IV pili twitching motility protein PilT n=1 Tax=Candidatus Methylomirabilis limnetica TaxID=2033718 RepID=A0A2T4TVG8_9BACT|nr:type IV pilus twitching motility protein PilT [Candidatus Methylomirabilis limnetica]PTL35099.1 type IV pili twitching motility protein PilT [Candidatus Methylomirabilis limnetica]
MNLHEMLKEMFDRGASDLHLTVGVPPMLRVHGRILPLGDVPLAPAETKSLAYSVLTDAQKRQFEEEKELDLSFGIKDLSRFRANLYNQRGAVGMAIRAIPYAIRPFEELGLPKIVADLCEKPKGLILVTGATGSGKSTTLATMIDKINSEHHEHIVTIEDPIEFLHHHKSCIVNQREVHSDTQSFAEALRRVLRQDPDKVLIGEMRDLETIAAALTIAETGHLTFATLHTSSAVETINRVIDVFPANQQPQIRAQLSFVLEGVLCQALVPKSNGQGRVLVLEVMIPNPAIRNLIREDKIHQIYSTMQAGQDKFGMQTMNQSLLGHYLRRNITLEEAMLRSSLPDELTQMIQRAQQKSRV